MPSYNFELWFQVFDRLPCHCANALMPLCRCHSAHDRSNAIPVDSNYAYAQTGRRMGKGVCLFSSSLNAFLLDVLYMVRIYVKQFMAKLVAMVQLRQKLHILSKISGRSDPWNPHLCPNCECVNFGVFTAP